MTFSRLSILGVGLLGGSIGLAVKSLLSGCHVVGYGHHPQTLELARSRGAVDQFSESAADAVQDADLVILCTPVGTFRSLLQEIASSLKPGALVTDVGSTKRTVCRLAKELLPQGVHFVGSHPMAGSEKRGVEAARADLFQRALCITTPSHGANHQAVAAVESFWNRLGMRTTRLSPEDHDRMLAEVSHLPHALAAALMATQDDAAVHVAGKGLLDTTRIAAGDGGLWRDIFVDNADNLHLALTKLRAQLDRFEMLLKDPKGDALKDWLDRAAQRRRSLTPPERSERQGQ
jgi:prephenate dehydrogenase